MSDESRSGIRKFVLPGAPGSIAAGIVLGLAFEFAGSMVLTIVGSLMQDGAWLRMFWGVPAIFVAVPVASRLAKRGQGLTAKALVVTVFLGLVMSLGFFVMLSYVMDHMPG
jgi:hypothetical protein